jgi:hypothetical protein
LNLIYKVLSEDFFEYFNTKNIKRFLYLIESSTNFSYSDSSTKKHMVEELKKLIYFIIKEVEKVNVDKFKYNYKILKMFNKKNQPLEKKQKSTKKTKKNLKKKGEFISRNNLMNFKFLLESYLNNFISFRSYYEHLKKEKKYEHYIYFYKIFYLIIVFNTYIQRFVKKY